MIPEMRGTCYLFLVYIVFVLPLKKNPAIRKKKPILLTICQTKPIKIQKFKFTPKIITKNKTTTDRLDLSHNHLVGPIPTELGGLESLRKFNHHSATENLSSYY